MESLEIRPDNAAGVLDQELSDEELEAVVGGLSRVYISLADMPMRSHPERHRDDV